MGEKNKPTVASTLLTHLMAFVFFVLFPALVTAIAPVSYLRFEKQADGVAFSGTQCLLFFIPYKSYSIPSVTGIGDKVIASRVRTAEERRRFNSGPGVVEGEAALIVTGADDRTESVPVSPASIKSVEERARKFVESPTDKPLSIFVVANWKFSLFVGGMVSLLTVLYVVGIVLSIFHRILKVAGLSKAGETLAPVEENRDSARD
ncbi:MAG: hypothetical protein KDA68_11970 [Planctomycetaceae bacterium]|nr:hypothetical protein [Planctomycetaceae bacterium]